MMVMILIITLIIIGASQLLFLFLNMEDGAVEAKRKYQFEVAKLNSEDINVFRLGDKYPPSRSVYRVDIRKGVII